MVATPNTNNISEFIFHGLDILNSLRKDSTLLTDQAVETLANQLCITEKNNSISLTKRKINIFAKKIISYAQSLKIFFGFFKSIGQFISQYALLKDMEKKYRSCSVIAIASNRLFSERLHSSVRKYLSVLCRDFLTGNLSDELNSFFSEENIIILHDPCHYSKFWNHRKSLANENIFILDTYFLFFVSLLKILNSKFNFFKNLCRRFKANKFKSKEIAISFCIDGLSSLFSPYLYIHSFFLTSNSLLTEVLRFFLIREEKCVSACEIMHGVPTLFYEKYIDHLLEVGRLFHSHEKHSSIAQIPNLPMFGILKEDVKYKPEYSINSYLNQYIYNAISKDCSFEQYLEREINLLFKKKVNQNTFIISFVGSFFPDQDSLRPNFFESKYFKVELKIMQYLINFLNKKDKNFTIIYTPHPCHDITKFFKETIFHENNILLYTNTILTWFIADLSLSILSSAVFEGSYFGVSGFMLSDFKDGVYPKELLSTLDFYNETQTHKSERTFYQKLEEFTEKNMRKPFKDPLTKVKERIQTFNYVFGEL